MTAGRLPRGRHGLSREQVARSQRERMLRAMAEAVAAKGYAATTVADVLTRAGVSRETFYQQFRSKEDCFLETFDAAGAIVLGRLGEAAREEGSGDPLERVLDTYLGTLAAEPAFARVFLVEGHAAGPEAVRRRVALQARFTDALARMLDAEEPHERFACELLVAAMGAMVTTRLALGDAASLPELKAPIVDLVRRVR